MSKKHQLICDNCGDRVNTDADFYVPRGEDGRLWFQYDQSTHLCPDCFYTWFDYVTTPLKDTLSSINEHDKVMP